MNVDRTGAPQVGRLKVLTINLAEASAPGPLNELTPTRISLRYHARMAPDIGIP
jgi:hypothetical protein